MKKLLLTTVFRPFGVDDQYGNATTLAEFHHTNLTRAQGIFSIRGANPNLGLHFIAENLQIPTMVIENPSLDEFKQELKKGYAYVGINFAPTTFAKAKKMCELTKEISPSSKTIVGGYGTAVPEAAQMADYVCRGEGVQFMRKLLGEPQDRPLKHPRVYNPAGETMGIQLGKAGLIAAGLGCPRGCEFCLTSHYFDCKHLPLLRTGKEVFQVMMDQAQGMPLKKRTRTRDFLILEEDFLLDKKRVTELASYTKKELDKPILFACFGAADSIMQYDLEELASTGLECVWLGVESPDQYYKKLKGIDLKQLISSLHDHGIMTIASMVLGYDFHTEETIQQHIDYMLSLESTFNQFMLYTPLPGTPLFKKALREKRILNLPWKDFDGFHFTMKHPHIAPERMEEIQREAYRKDFHQLGPSIMRALETNFKGYQRFKDSDSPILRRRAEIYRDSCCFSLAVSPAAIRYAPNKKIKDRISALQDRLIAEFGLSSQTRWASRYVSAKLALQKVKERFFPAKAAQPKLVSKSFRMSPHEATSAETIGRKLEGVKNNILEISVHEMEKIQAKLVVFKGNLNDLTVEKINERLLSFLEKSKKHLILDFGEISHIEPQAIQALLKKLENYQQRIKFVFQQNHIDKIINRLEGKLPSFEIFVCREELIASFAYGATQT
jgi:radical SAM superfamily enzyme YgiQ (UPF0313 family)/anti-anti-sigma regulatory factor